MKHAQSVREQFGHQAGAYLDSPVHSGGKDLATLAELAADVASGGHVLDMGCGAGHASYAMAPAVGHVMACDLSEAMLAIVREEATRRQLDNITTCRTAVEQLPFENDSFALAATRYSAHHWSDPMAGLAELRRVLEPGGQLCLIDVVGPESALINTHLQAVEVLRDRSHVCDYSRSCWRAMLATAGFELIHEESWRLPIHLDAWLTRMATPADRAAGVRALLSAAPEEVKRHYHLDPGSLDFELESALFLARLA